MTTALAIVPRENWQVIFGPPGAGKTTKLLAYLSQEMQRGTPPKEIAFVSFTRAAQDEARRRAAKTLRCLPDDLKWFRTIHSMGFRLLGLGKGDLVTPKLMETFAAKHGYEFSRVLPPDEDDPTDYGIEVRRPDDKLLATLAWARNRRVPLADAARLSPFGVSARHFDLFVQRYTAMREREERYDFHDLLEGVLAQDLKPPVRVAFIDEAQDLSPMQVAVVERWFWTCERVYVAGDDDQAIYSFLGGDPDWLLSLSHSCRIEILEQSYRVPKAVHAMAEYIIARNTKRVPKTYRPTGHEGQIVVADRRSALDLIDESEDTYVLSRSWYPIRSFAKDLRKRGIAFRVEKHPTWSPLGVLSTVAAWKAVLELQAGGTIHAKQCRAIFDLIPANTDSLMPKGAKKLAKENKDPVDLAVLRSWDLSYLALAIEKTGTAVLLKVTGRVRTELEAIMRRYGCLPEPKVTLVSIHSSKGRQADTVIVLPQLSRATNMAMAVRGPHGESENRLAYVAVTRTKRRLIICKSESRRSYPYEEIASRIRIPQVTEDDWQFGD